ncbi:MAG: hypothetical protein WC455_15420 [Dehalococcoidia bacterium]|jgi:hypothetical protein
MVFWDWLSTSLTARISDGSFWAVPLGGTIALLWWMAISFPRSKMMGAAVVAGAMVGTTLGILWT